MKGLEYLTADVLENLWTALDNFIRAEIAANPGRGAQEYLQEKNPLWRLVGRVTFHLAENKRDPDRPFAFMATYTHRLSAQGQPQHFPLKHALQEYATANNRDALVSLLTPVQCAAEKSALAAELVNSKDLYKPLAWTPREAYRFLQDLPFLEDSGIIVRIPDWWKRTRPPHPQVSVKIGEAAQSRLSAEALLDFSVTATLNGETLTEQDIDAILHADSGLLRLKGQWIEIDRDKFQQALDHWKGIEKLAGKDGISFAEGMRLLSGVPLETMAGSAMAGTDRQWIGISAGTFLEQTLRQLRDPAAASDDLPKNLHATLRPYQQSGVHWLRFLSRLGLGACLADDMGLGKTLQVLTLLLHIREQRTIDKTIPPSLLIVPTSLLANWQAEQSKFAPTLSLHIAHPSEENGAEPPSDETLHSLDLLITSYGMLPRLKWLTPLKWNLLILDEAQAIKNSGSRQSVAVKQLSASARIALTGTPIENRLSDLWSLFDFLNPGLLGNAKAFQKYVKSLAASDHADYAPLRSLVRPYILRRLKTDKRIISDLPEKTEMQTFCTLTPPQAALYQDAVDDLKQKLESADGIHRRGIILAALMRFKQICNHPSQWLGDNNFDPAHSGKFNRLRALCEEFAERQEKPLIFTQFREITAPLADFLRNIFHREGLVLHGQTSVPKRRQMVDAFQRDDGPPFFVLSLKAGGTGLNLTAATHVIHFDRWWNPAVENQATDRAFRIGQKRNVLVHKFVCRGTVEERIDDLIRDKIGLARDILDDAGEGEIKLTEMNNAQLLRFVSLDIHKAAEG